MIHAMTLPQILITIFLVAVGTFLTRLVPFLLFPDGKPLPKVVEDLGKLLPPAMMGLLVMYCLKDVSLFSAPHGLPEGIAILITTVLHLWKRNALVSIAAGTASYMVLVQVIFS